MGKVELSSSNNYSNDGKSKEYKVGFFSLPNDKDTAIVRILHDSVQSIDTYDVHTANVNNKRRKINCIRDARAPLNACPLCSINANNPELYKMQRVSFIRLIQYVMNDDGTVKETQSKIWERPSGWVYENFGDLMTEYPNFSDRLVKITRHGVPKDKQTFYSIVPIDKERYNPALFTKDTSDFDGYSELGGLIIDKTYDEIDEFVATGEFPYKKKEESKVEAKPEAVNRVQDIDGKPGIPFDDYVSQPSDIPTQPVNNVPDKFW